MADGRKGKLPKTAKREKEKRAAAATNGDEMAHDVIITGGSFKVELRSKEGWTVR